MHIALYDTNAELLQFFGEADSFSDAVRKLDAQIGGFGDKTAAQAARQFQGFELTADQADAMRYGDTGYGAFRRLNAEYDAPDAEPEDEIPSDVIAAASLAALEEGRDMMIGRHPYYGYVYRDAADEGAVAELRDPVRCTADGVGDLVFPAM